MVGTHDATAEPSLMSPGWIGRWGGGMQKRETHQQKHAGELGMGGGIGGKVKTIELLKEDGEGEQRETPRLPH